MHKFRAIIISVCLVLMSLSVMSVYAQTDDTCQTGDEGFIYHVERAAYLRGSGDNEGALFNYQCAYNLDENSVPVVKGLGYVNIRLGRLDTALSYFQKAANLAPDDAVSYYNLGWMAALQGENDQRNHLDQDRIDKSFQQALFYYKRAEDIDPDLKGLPYNRGVLYRDMGNDAMAIKEFEDALARNFEPKYKTLLNLADIYYQQRKLDEAWDYYERAASDNGGAFTLDDIVPLDLAQYKNNTQIERFLKRYLPIILFIIVVTMTILYALIRRIRNFLSEKTNEAISPISTEIESSPSVITAPATITQDIQAVPAPASSSGLRWWLTALTVPVIMGGLYAVQRWLTGEES